MAFSWFAEDVDHENMCDMVVTLDEVKELESAIDQQVRVVHDMILICMLMESFLCWCVHGNGHVFGSTGMSCIWTISPCGAWWGRSCATRRRAR